jgi:hypothetical protein
MARDNERRFLRHRVEFNIKEALDKSVIYKGLIRVNHSINCSLCKFKNRNFSKPEFFKLDFVSVLS